MPKRPSTLNIDHSRLLIGSPEEGYMVHIDHRVFHLHAQSNVSQPLTQTIWQNVQGMTQRIDRLSEGLALVVQRHRDKGRHRHLKPSRSDKDRHSHSDYPGVSDPYVRDNTQQKNYYLGRIDESSDSGSVYSFASSQSTLIGNQAQNSPGHAGHYYHPSSNAQPSYPSPQIVNMNHYGRFSTNSSPIISDASGRNRSHGYFPEYPSSESLSYFPGGRPNPSQPGTPLYQTPMTPGTNPSLWRIPAEMPNVSNFNNAPFVNYVGQKPGLHLEYPQNFQKTSGRHTHRNRK